jgi:hypothetical protein
MQVAVKCIKKGEMTQEDIDALDIEKSVMRKVCQLAKCSLKYLSVQ